MFFRVKFYVENVSMLRLSQTRHQYYLQLRKDILGEGGAEGGAEGWAEGWEGLRDGAEGWGVKDGRGGRGLYCIFPSTSGSVRV